MKNYNKKALNNMTRGFVWRCIGPPRGGRVVAVAGDPMDPMTFYFGACAGGVWKTVDGGTYWECISDGYLNSATIGALAVSESDRNVIYAGTGETTIRVDVSFGDGLYRSTDGGQTWSHLGLENTRHIGEIRIHPQDPEVVYVAALGHAFGENPERGVYRSVDGGQNWDLVLYQSSQAGAVDLSLDPNNPRIIFASIWEARRNFWNLSSGGPGSGLFRSKDGGDCWEEVSTKQGFATGTKGKIGVSICPAQTGRVWALVEAESAGLYRTEDYGETWTCVSENRDLLHRPWYYTHVFADPCHKDTVYVTNLQMWKSTDGGANFEELTTPHGDNHDLWIDPSDNRRMIQGNDGGATVSFNGGKTWSTIYNQKTAQLYRLDVDDQFPYRVYGTQQDNTTISVPSATEWGVITMNDCSFPGTGESGYVAVHPDNPNIVYSGAVGSSPGGNGALQRYNHQTKQIGLINVWPEESTGLAPKDLRYRFAWTFPIAFSPHDSKTIFAGGNHLFRSHNEGQSWETVSPDLSRNDSNKLGLSGGPLTIDSAGAEQYATLSVFVESHHRSGEYWVGTDDGLVHFSSDSGLHWDNLTSLVGIPDWSYISSIEISNHSADTIYISATRYKLDDYQPYLYRTKDGGKTWQSIVGDFPEGEITRVIRADIACKDLLFVGTETGIFFSCDDGSHWFRMQGGLPVVPVYDLKIKNSDLIVATHGRSFWILDDITPLREFLMTPLEEKHGIQLFRPRDTYRLKLQWSAGIFDGEGKDYSPAFGIAGTTYRQQNSDGTIVRRHLDVGENPPSGVILYYWLTPKLEAPLTLSLYDESGILVADFSDISEKKAEKYLPKNPGLNRFIWDFSYPAPISFDPALIERDYRPLAKESKDRGPMAPPGKYRVELSIAGNLVASKTFCLLKDPRVATPQVDFEKQFELLHRLNEARSTLRTLVNRIRFIRRQLRDLLSKLPQSNHEVIVSTVFDIDQRLVEIENILVDANRESPRDVLRHPAGLDDTLGELISAVSMADIAPPIQTVKVSEEIINKVNTELSEVNKLIVGSISILNKRADEARVPAIVA